jgi:hypothetical protein
MLQRLHLFCVTPGYQQNAVWKVLRRKYLKKCCFGAFMLAVKNVEHHPILSPMLLLTNDALVFYNN